MSCERPRVKTMKGFPLIHLKRHSLLFGPLYLLFCIFSIALIRNQPQDHHLKSNHSSEDTRALIFQRRNNRWTLDRSSFQTTDKSELNKCVWPECRASEDRIVNQLMLDKDEELDRIVHILPPDNFLPIGQQVFLDEGCKVDNCHLTYDSAEADVLIFQNSDLLNETVAQTRRPEQIWVAYLLESPVHTFDRRFSRSYRGKHVFNWTASYRSDSDLVTPYSKFVPYSKQLAKFEELKSRTYNRTDGESLKKFYESSSPEQKALIKGKFGKVVWLASNCNAANNRLEYANELAQYIQVDIFGRCGNLTCRKWDNTCLEMINRKYKFYLSFENSNCQEYITEKLYKNAYGYNDLNHLMLPIVMGPSREDYEDLVPPASFIHIDDFESPKKLAHYLIKLDQDDTLYYSYFQWKLVGQFIDTKFMCRVCAMAHHSIRNNKRKHYESIKDWWNNHTTTRGNKQEQTSPARALGILSACY